jgi:2-isopropylmalate synthase
VQGTGESSPSKLIIFDTTLRDGEQAPGISLDPLEKLEIAEQLARLGVDYIEAGFPVASQGDFDAVRMIAERVEGPAIAALARTHLEDIDTAWRALKAAARSRIHVFISTSPQHLEYMLKMTPEQVINEVRQAVSRAKEHTDDVEFSPQDATRTPFDFMLEVLSAALECGATCLNIPDTVGYAIPWEFGELIARIKKELPGDYVISTHCHNDLGLAVANSLAGVKNGARQVEVCINGIGERAGNAALEEVVMAVLTRPEEFGGLEVGVNTTEIARTSRLVSRLTGYPIQYNKAIVGRNAFAHESGIHQHGVLENRITYEIIDADRVGQRGSQIVLGKHSGRHAFQSTLEKMGIRVSGEVLNAAFRRFKELADRKVEITEADLEAIVSEELAGEGQGHADWVLERMEVSGGTDKTPTAYVRLSRAGEVREATAEGDGMIDAACKAVEKATGVSVTLTDFSVSSVTGGIDALGDVVIQLEADGLRVSGRGLSTDVVEASARAFLNGINRLLRVRERAEQRKAETGP